MREKTLLNKLKYWIMPKSDIIMPVAKRTLNNLFQFFSFTKIDKTTEFNKLASNDKKRITKSIGNNKKV